MCRDGPLRRIGIVDVDISGSGVCTVPPVGNAFLLLGLPLVLSFLAGDGAAASGAPASISCRAPAAASGAPASISCRAPAATTHGTALQHADIQGIHDLLLVDGFCSDFVQVQELFRIFNGGFISCG